MRRLLFVYDEAISRKDFIARCSDLVSGRPLRIPNQKIPKELSGKPTSLFGDPNDLKPSNAWAWEFNER